MKDLYQPLTVQTKQIVENLLALEDHNVSKVARILKITRSTVYNILATHQPNENHHKNEASQEEKKEV